MVRTTTREAGSTPRASSTRDWEFDVGGTPLSESERQTFSHDLARLGRSDVVLDNFNAVLGCRTQYSQPRLLRGYTNGELAGVALFMECRKSGQCFFQPPLSTLIDLPKLPVFVWSRYDFGVDNNANPGLVAEGIDRRTFRTEALAELQRNYLQGSVIELRGEDPVPGGIQSPGFDSGYVDLDLFTDVDEFVRRRKRLRNKLKAFRNKGGTIETVRGALDQKARETCAGFYDTMQFRLLTPYQDILADMVRNTLAVDHPDAVHFVARIDEQIVGYHSFILGDGVLICASGGFDRSLRTTHNAYDTMIVESVRLAMDEGLRQIQYGPVLNQTKAGLMTSFVTQDAYTYVRYGLMRRPIASLLKRSVLESDEVRRFRDLGNGTNSARVEA